MGRTVQAFREVLMDQVPRECRARPMDRMVRGPQEVRERPRDRMVRACSASVSLPCSVR